MTLGRYGVRVNQVTCRQSTQRRLGYVSPPERREPKAETSSRSGDKVDISELAQVEAPKSSWKKKLGVGLLGALSLAGALVGLRTSGSALTDMASGAVCDAMITQTMGGKVDDPQLQTRADWALDEVRDSFPDLRMEAKVLGSEDTNATVCATGEHSGNVYFTRGTLQKLDDQETIFVAAHEAGHLKLHNHDGPRDDHQAEKEADKVGLNVLKDKGIPESAAHRALRKISDSETGASHTHPDLQSRLDALM